MRLGFLILTLVWPVLVDAAELSSMQPGETRVYVNPEDVVFHPNPKTGQVVVELKNKRGLSSAKKKMPSHVSLRREVHRFDSLAQARQYEQLRTRAQRAHKKIMICPRCADPIRVSQVEAGD